MTSIRTIIGLAVKLYLKIEQLDVKTTLLRRNLYGATRRFCKIKQGIFVSFKEKPLCSQTNSKTMVKEVQPFYDPT
ncbi:hypothetical protein CR513_61493, partial [Mucuna pruriens]